MRGDKNCILTLYYKTDVIKIYLISMINSKMILLKENSAPVRERERERATASELLLLKTTSR